MSKQYQAEIDDEFLNPQHYKDFSTSAVYRLTGFGSEDRRSVEEKLREQGKPARMWRDGEFVLEIGGEAQNAD